MRLALVLAAVGLLLAGLWLALSGGRVAAPASVAVEGATERAEAPAREAELSAAELPAPERSRREPLAARRKQGPRAVEEETLAPDEVAVQRGKVVSRSGRGIPDALVKALPMRAGGVIDCQTTDEHGEFELNSIGPGRYHLLAQGVLAVSAPLEVALRAGENRPVVLTLPVEDSPGPIRGRLVASAGKGDPYGVVVVRQGGSERRLAVPTRFELFSGGDDGEAEFQIAGLPPGEYVLSLVSVDGRPYEPAELRVSPPAEGLEFRSDELPRGYAFSVRQAGSGEAIERALVLGRIQDQWWGGEDPPSLTVGFERWIAYAPGFRPQRGDFRRAGPFTEEDDVMVAHVEVELTPGFGLAVLFKDAASPSLVAPAFEDCFGAGIGRAQVLADGRVVATSDADGLALVDLPRAPARLEFRKVGWRMAGEREEDGLRWVHMLRAD
jgi:hypothetical protein